MTTTGRAEAQTSERPTKAACCRAAAEAIVADAVRTWPDNLYNSYAHRH